MKHKGRDDPTRYSSSPELNSIYEIGKTREQQDEEWRRKPPGAKFRITLFIWLALVLVATLDIGDFEELRKWSISTLAKIGWLLPAYYYWKMCNYEGPDE